MIIGIVAIAENFAIGKGGKLPWHYPADMAFFKKTTVGNAVVMGMNTWRSIKKPLPKRLNVVLTRTSPEELPVNVIAMSNVEEVEYLSGFLNCEVYVIGGAAIYGLFASRIDRWIVTHVPQTVAEADVFFDKGLFEDFEEYKAEDLGDGLRVSFMQRK